MARYKKRTHKKHRKKRFGHGVVMIDRKYLDAHPNPNVHITYGGKLRSGHGVLRRDSEGWYPNIAAAGGSVHRRSRRTRRGGSFRLP